MRHPFLIFTFLFFIGYLQLNAQSENNESIIPVMKEVESLINNLEDDYYTINSVEFGLVRDSESSVSQVELVGGRTYNIMLFGESSIIMDIDMKIHSEPSGDQVLLKYENNNENILSMDFRPEESALYDIEIIVEKFHIGSSAGRYALIISH